jgi:hypothetical protein
VSVDVVVSTNVLVVEVGSVDVGSVVVGMGATLVLTGGLVA